MNIDECCLRNELSCGENKAMMKNVIVVQLRCILEQAVTAASNIISVRGNVLLESSTCTSSASLVHASPVSKYCNRAYLTKRRLDGLLA